MRWVLLVFLLIGCTDNSDDEMRLFQASLNEESSGLPDLPANGVRVFLLTGQSNAVGRALNSSATAGELAAQTHFNIWNPTAGAFQNLDVGTNNLSNDPSTEHGVELGLAANIQAYWSTETEFYLIKHAVSSTEIDQHLTGGSVYTTFWSRVQNGINNLITAGKIPYVYLVFSQGERDANPATDPAGDTPAAHYAKFGTWIDLWRTNIGTDLPIVAYETLNFYSGSLEVNANMLAYEALRDKYNMLPMVSETDIGDGLHFDYQAQKNASIKALDFFINYNGQPVTTTIP